MYIYNDNLINDNLITKSNKKNILKRAWDST